jgi:phytoene dehydrogenase-like protein
MVFRLSSIARILDEAFDNDLLKGIWAQSAVAGTGASPHAPASAALLARSWILAGAAPDLGYRFVVGGQVGLRQALLDQLRRFNNADVRFAGDVKEITAERDAVQGISLADGSVLRAPLVISSLSPNRNRELLAGFRRPPPPVHAPSARASVAPAMLKLTLANMPKFPGLDAATLNAGAIVRLDPSLARLTRAHGAFRERTLTTEPCLDMRLSPRQGTDGKPRWTMHVAMTYLPVVTTEGPWAGNRRDRLRTLCVRAINALVPDFAAAIEAAEILRPAESETVMDPNGAAALAAKASLDLTGVPDARGAAAPSLVKGLTVLEPSLYASNGDAGLLAAQSVLGPRLKASADA